MPLKAWGDSGPRPLRMKGGAWPSVVLVEITSSGVLVEAPAEPRVPVGMIGHIEVEDLRAQTVVDAIYPHTDASRVFYAVRVIEIDRGFMDAVDRCAAKRGVVSVRRTCPLMVAVGGQEESVALVPEPTRLRGS